MKDNIFEGAKFGDKFITRDGRCAIFSNTVLRRRCIVSYFLLEDRGIAAYNYDDNTCISCEKKYDIVSRYKETIDEDKLDELAYNSVGLMPPFNKEEKRLLWENISDIQKHEFFSYKAGYRKAKEN